MKKILFICLLTLCLCQPGQTQDVKKELNLCHSTSFVAFPIDCNSNPPMVFGGKILSEMDRCAAITTKRLLYDSPNNVRDYVTIAINNVKFHSSAQVKDLIFVTGKVVKIGSKSITVNVIVEREVEKKRELLVDGEFVFVAYDVVNKVAVQHGIKPTE